MSTPKTTRTGSRPLRRATHDENTAHMNQFESEGIWDPRTRTAPLKKKGDLARRPKPSVPLGEVIEISSDDDDPPPPPTSTIADLRTQVTKLKEENTKVRSDLAQAQHELSKLKSSPQATKSKIVLDISNFDDNINCDICSSRMWSPHVLPDCGHAFCQSCLQDWFSSTLAKFMATHPDYNVNNPAHLHQLQALRHNAHIYHNPNYDVYLANMLQQAPQPQYTCPSCREPVKNRPVEDFTLKALIRTLSTATGEKSPHGRGLEKPRRGMTKASSPWDGFFPIFP